VRAKEIIESLFDYLAIMIDAMKFKHFIAFNNFCVAFILFLNRNPEFFLPLTQE
jgi:hypothetical protein